MGIVNAGEDSFSDAVRLDTLERQVAHGLELAPRAPTWSTSARSRASPTRRAATAEEEAARVVPLVERLAAEGVSVSVDTWKPEVARAALDAGAVDAQRRQRAARSRAGRARRAHGRGARAHAHARRAQAARRSPTTTTSRPTSRPSCASGSTLALAHGVADEQIVLDPGPDFAKTPAQTVAVLRDLDRLHALGRPLLLAISRKYFLGAITGPPAGRAPGGHARRRGVGGRRGGRDPARPRRRRRARRAGGQGRPRGRDEVPAVRRRRRGAEVDPGRPLACRSLTGSPAAAHNAVGLPTDTMFKEDP